MSRLPYVEDVEGVVDRTPKPPTNAERAAFTFTPWGAALAESVRIVRQLHDERCDVCTTPLTDDNRAPSCGAHVECVECASTNPCRECAAYRSDTE